MEAASIETASADRRTRLSDRIGLRTRITMPLLLPILGVLILTGILVSERLATVSAMRRVGMLTELVIDTSALVHELQRERGISAGFIGSKGAELRTDLISQRTRTDSRRDALGAKFQRIDPAAAAAGLPASIAAARAALGNIGDIRRRIDGLALTGQDSFAFFTAANAALLALTSEAEAGVAAPGVARSVSVYLSFLNAKELAGQERAVGAAGFAAGRFDAARLRQLNRLSDQQDLYFQIIAATAPEAQTGILRQILTGEAVAAVARMRAIAGAGGLEGHLEGITGAEWFKAATVRIDLLKQAEDRMASDLTELAAGIRAGAEQRLYETLAAGLALLAVTAIVAVLMIRAIVGPLRHAIQAMRKLAAGDPGIQIEPTSRQDELGGMARAVLVFRDQAVENQRLVAAREQERAAAEAEKHSALRGMAETIEAETNKALARVNDTTVAMESTADRMTGSAARTRSSASSAASAASQALYNAQSVASAAEELSASIREISSQVHESTAVVNRAVAAGDRTRTSIAELDSKVEQIGAIADMIRTIAAKTNLLALNATIEAARAGEAGKGFAVVAGEVKDLATQTARSTEEISQHLTEVRAATQESVAAVGLIGDTITEIDAISASIAAAVEQQGAATAEIARNVTQTAQSADEMTNRIGEVAREAEENGRQAAQVRSGAAALGTAVRELKHTVMRVVRTSTTEVDRRLLRRFEVDFTCRLLVTGLDPLPARVVDLSEGGARLLGAPALPPGTRGTLEVEGTGIRAVVTVRNQHGDSLGVVFEQDDKSAAAIRAVLERTAARLAA